MRIIVELSLCLSSEPLTFFFKISRIIIVIFLFTTTQLELFSLVKANSELRTFKQSNIQEVNSLEEIPGSKNYFIYGKYICFFF